MKRPLVFALLFIILVNIPISSGAVVTHPVRKQNPPVQHVKPQPVQQQKPHVPISRPHVPIQKPIVPPKPHPQNLIITSNHVGGRVNPIPHRPSPGGYSTPHLHQNPPRPNPYSPRPHIGDSINPHPGGWWDTRPHPHPPTPICKNPPCHHIPHPPTPICKNPPCHHIPHPPCDKPPCHHVPHPPACKNPPCHNHPPHPSPSDGPKPVTNGQKDPSSPSSTSGPSGPSGPSGQNGPNVNAGPQPGPQPGPNVNSGPQPGPQTDAPAPQTGPQPGAQTGPQPNVSGPQPGAQSGPQPDASGPQSQDSANGSPCKVAPTRQGIVAAAMWAHNSGKYITYSQGGSRWSGITQKACPFQSVPQVTDCSAFVTWLYWSAFGNGRDFLNNQNWKAGYTGTMGSNGTPVSLAQARPGDVVLYGRAPYEHAVLYVGNNQVVSFGQNGPAKLVPINYRSDYNIRSYLP